MMSRITKLSATNFRSLNGTIDLDLDAPVVLVHGPNGSGKTSFLSALEFGLTGQVEAMRRTDGEYRSDLVHYDTDQANVFVECRHQDGQLVSRAQSISSDGLVQGRSLLSSQQAKLFTERSFLAQATLGRLLEIYETNDTRDGQNALTRFVQELLGLEVLDSLVEGIKPTTHVAKLRKAVPQYREAEAVEAELEKKSHRLKERFDVVALEIEEHFARLNEQLANLPFDGDLSLPALLENLEDTSEADEFSRVREIDREISSANQLISRISPLARDEIGQSESDLSAAKISMRDWASENEQRFLQVAEIATQYLANLPSPSQTGRERFRTTAVRELSALKQRDDSRLQRDEAAREERNSAQSTLAKATERAERLGNRLEALSSSSGDLARALSEVSPFVRDDTCPVCNRDFKETSQGTLQSHLSGQIASLTTAAVEMQSVSSERQMARREIKEATERLDACKAQILAEEDKNSLKIRTRRIAEVLKDLLEIETITVLGDSLSEQVRTATEKLSKLRQDVETSEAIRKSSYAFAEALDITGINLEDSTADVLTACQNAAQQKLEQIRAREGDRTDAIETLRELISLEEEKKRFEASIERTNAQIQKVKYAFKTVKKIRQDLKTLSNSAVAVRTDIVRQVFNESLNSIWKDLFVRLAPEEPFVPEFALPEIGSGSVKAELKTTYRNKQGGGNPKAMLSAGNLNTAALTLFLSLHLSASNSLPWLVLDDPVQNMDDIHVAQFSALLRTLTRQNKRQVIIAVHEKALFDYLTLELSPATVNDSLITVELSRASDGLTTYDPKLHTWDPKRIFHATG